MSFQRVKNNEENKRNYFYNISQRYFYGVKVCLEC